MPQGQTRHGVYTPTALDRMVADEVERRNLSCLMLYPPNTPVVNGAAAPHVVMWLGLPADRREVRH